jgi:hypothetical protein
MIGLNEDEAREVGELETEARALDERARIARARRRLLLERGRQREKRKA